MDPLHPQTPPGPPADSSIPPLITPPLLQPPPPPSGKQPTRWGRVLVVMLILAVAGIYLRRFREPSPEPPPRTLQWRQSPRPPVVMNRPTPRVRTPKPAREEVAGPRAAAPIFETAGRVFTEQLVVKMNAPAGGKIRYTLDGSEPNAESPLYTEPISLSATTLVKAKAFADGVAPSLTASETYTLLDKGLAEFSSNLPLVIINAFGQGFSKQAPVSASIRIMDGKGQRTSLLSSSDYDGRCEIKLRGFSSLRFPKHSLTVKTRTDSDASRKVSLLGMPEDSEWVLYAPYSDKTLMRDVLAYELSNKIGRYAARTRYVEVFLNRSGGKLSPRDYVGVYVLEEKIKRGKERVNIAKLKPEMKSEPDITGGYIFKRDHLTGPDGRFGGPFSFFNNRPQPQFAADDGSGFTTSRGMHLFYVEPKEKEITEAQKEYLTGYLNQLEHALYSSNFKSPTEGYAKYLDVDSFIDQFWIVELSKNVDGFRYSCYMSKDRNGKLRMEPIWDWNLSFGNANYHDGWMPQQWYWPLLRDREVNWYNQLRKDPEFVQRLTDRWSELRRTAFAPETICKRVDEIAANLEEAQGRNFQRWQILGQFVNPNWYIGSSYEDEVNWMKNWIQERIAWIDSQFISPPQLVQQPASKASTTQVTMESGAGTIYYTLDGSDPRQRGGGVSQHAHEYSEPIFTEKGTKLFARAHNEQGWSGPARVGF